MAIHSEAARANRRAIGQREVALRKAVALGERLAQIATAGPCTAPGPRYSIAQNVGRSGAPLWVHLSVVTEQPGQLVFCGNRPPLEFSQAQVVELAPYLGQFMGRAEFRQIAAG